MQDRGREEEEEGKRREERERGEKTGSFSFPTSSPLSSRPLLLSLSSFSRPRTISTSSTCPSSMSRGNIASAIAPFDTRKVRERKGSTAQSKANCRRRRPGPDTTDSGHQQRPGRLALQRRQRAAGAAGCSRTLVSPAADRESFSRARDAANSVNAFDADLGGFCPGRPQTKRWQAAHEQRALCLGSLELKRRPALALPPRSAALDADSRGRARDRSPPLLASVVLQSPSFIIT